MKDLVSENLTLRIRWLQQILESNISLTSNELLGLANVRSFCGLSKKGWFQKISYNTLKYQARNFKPKNAELPDVIDYWAYLMDLRVQANEKARATKKLTGNQELPNGKDLAKKSLMEAHLCFMAYREIFNFLDSLTTKNELSIDEIQLLISNQLSISSEKFKIINSFTDIETDRKQLRLIQGGKQ